MLDSHSGFGFDFSEVTSVVAVFLCGHSYVICGEISVKASCPF